MPLAEQDRILTLVFTDFVDSTAFKDIHGDQAFGEIVNRHRDTLQGLASEAGGRVIVWAGDGCFLTFETASSAVLFALRLQRTHLSDAHLPAIRIGVHMGEVTES